MASRRLCFRPFFFNTLRHIGHKLPVEPKFNPTELRANFLNTPTDFAAR
jgi:hypothetical protein